MNSTTVTPLTPITTVSQLQQGEQFVQIAATLATKGYLISVDPTKAASTAQAISLVSNAVLGATDQNTDLTQVRVPSPCPKPR